MRPLNLLKLIISLFTMSSLLSCTLKDKISTLNPDAVETTSSLSLKVQNSDSTNTSRVELEEGTLILATAILDKAKKKDIKLSVKITSSAGDARVLERFSSYSKTVTIAAGLTSGFISIQTIDDVSVQDGDEEFTLSIFPEDEDEFKNTSSFVTLVIKDNEDMPTVSFQSATQNKNEDDVSGQVNLELSQVSGQTVSVRVSAVDETAQAGTDYTYSSQVISFAPGEVSKPVSFNLTNRSGVQASRTFKFQLSDVNNGLITTNTTSINTSEHTVTIIDVDQAGLSISDVSVNEGSNAVFTVSLSSAYTSDVSVDYSVTALTAVAGTDYTTATGSVTIPTGSTTANITIATLANADVCAANKTFKVVLANAVNATLGDIEGVGTIIDITNPTVSLASSTSSVTEGSNTNISVNLSAVCATRNVTVEYSTTAGTATATTDFTTATAATLTITAGDSSGTISIPTANDTLDEVDETFTVTLSSPTNATLGATTTATVTITDNDAAPSVTLAASSNTISEGGTTVTLTATLSAVSAKSVSLPFTITGTGTQTSDYTISSSPLTIAAGSTTATITVTMVEDTDLEGDETVIVTLDTPTNASLGATTTQTITITDNDLGSFSISGITGENESTDDANLSNGLNPKINWGSSSGATGYKVSIVSDDQATTVCAEQTLGNVSTYQYSSGDCTLTVATYYRARVTATSGSIEQTASNTNFRFYVNTSPSLASNGEGPWYVMAGSSITINAVGGSSPTIGVASDTESDVMTFTAVGTSTLGTLTNNGSSIAFAATSGVNNHGRASVTYTITDARGGTRTGTIFIHVMQAHTWTGATSAAWNTASNWCGSIAAGNRACAGSGTAPGSASTTLNLYFDDTCASSFTCSPSTTSNISVQGVRMNANGFTQSAGHTLTVGSNGWRQSGGVFTGGNSTMTLNSLVLSSTASFTATTGMLDMTGNFQIQDSAVFTHNNGSLRLSGGSSTIAPNNQNFYNVETNQCSISFSNQTMNIENNLVLRGGYNCGLNNGTLRVNGNVTAHAGGGYPNVGSLIVRVVGRASGSTITGNASSGFTNLIIDAGTNPVTIAGTINITGNYATGVYTYISSGAFTSTGSTLTGNCTSFTITPGSVEYGNLTLSRAVISGSPIKVMGTVRINSSYSSGISGQSIHAYGDIQAYSSDNYGTLTNGNTTIVLKGNASGQTISGLVNPTYSWVVPNLERIELDTGTNPVTITGKLEIRRMFRVTSVGAFDASTSTLHFEGDQPNAQPFNFYISTLNLGSVVFESYGSAGILLNGGTLNVAGSMTFAGAATIQGGTVNLSGTSITVNENGRFWSNAYLNIVGPSLTLTIAASKTFIGNNLRIESTGAGFTLNSNATFSNTWATTVAGGNINLNGFTFATQSLALGGNTINKAGGIVQVNGVSIANGSVYGGTIAD